MSNNCGTVHHLFNGLPVFRFPFLEDDIPPNGIYVLFERGEFAHGVDRIVRVGTHTGNSQLRSRLRQHFVTENKDRSIFRKNIGRCLLNKEKDPFLKQWELDLTSRKAKEHYADLADMGKQKEIEKKVTDYIQSNFSFAVLRIDEKERRLTLESKIISTISLCDECVPSKEWLGLFSTKEKIRRSGLWLVNELYKKPLSEEDLTELQNITKTSGASLFHSG